MATKTVFQDVDLVEAIERAHQVSVLTDWIERARSLCDMVSTLAGQDPQFAQKLIDSDIRVNKALWEEEQSMAMELLCSVRQEALSEARLAAFPLTRQAVTA
jgi:hypothetical protein